MKKFITLCILTSIALYTYAETPQYRGCSDDIEENLIEIESKIDALSELVTEDGSLLEEILSKVCIIETALDSFVIG